MIILDTNVLSEALKPNPNPQVLAWIGSRNARTLFTTSTTEAEIRFGVARLPEGQRKTGLSKVINEVFTVDFTNRVLPFDSRCAVSYAQIASNRERLGHPISQFDAQIAAIAVTNGFAIATRNVSDFEACGIDIINPWQ
jgi:toxin FitB